MLSSVLKSERAIRVNIVIMRAFVKLREMISSHNELIQKLEKLERKYEHHDAQFKRVFDAIRKLIESPVGPQRRIGFTPSPEN